MEIAERVKIALNNASCKCPRRGDHIAKAAIDAVCDPENVTEDIIRAASRGVREFREEEEKLCGLPPSDRECYERAIIIALEEFRKSLPAVDHSVPMQWSPNDSDYSHIQEIVVPHGWDFTPQNGYVVIRRHTDPKNDARSIVTYGKPKQV